VLLLGLLVVEDGDCELGLLLGLLLWVCGVVLLWLDDGLELELDCAKATAAARMSAKNKLFFIGVSYS
jgi:hypothetical protein